MQAAPGEGLGAPREAFKAARRYHPLFFLWDERRVDRIDMANSHPGFDRVSLSGPPGRRPRRPEQDFEIGRQGKKALQAGAETWSPVVSLDGRGGGILSFPTAARTKG